MDKKKKCLFVATVVKTHINEFHLPYLEMFQEAGYETHVAARNDFRDTGEECVIPFCDRFIELPFARSPFNKANLEAYRKLKKLIDEEHYDVIHCHTPVGGMIARLAARDARKKGTRVIYTAHGFHFFKGAPFKNWLLYYPAERLAAHFTDLLITINQEDYKRAKNFAAKEIAYVPGVGIPVERFAHKSVNRLAKMQELGIPEDVYIVLMVGELSKRKNQSTILKVLAELKDTKAYGLFCGQGELQHALLKEAEDLGIQDRVKFLGFRRDVAEIYPIADVFLFPTLHEGLPVALMEAMSAGLPIVASNVRGNRDLIEDRVGGFLTEPYDVTAMAKAVRILMNHSERAQQMGQNSQRSVAAYHLDHVKEEMRKLYGL